MPAYMQLFYQSNPNVCSFDMNHIISFRNFSFGMVISHENKVNNTKLNLFFVLIVIWQYFCLLNGCMVVLFFLLFDV